MAVPKRRVSHSRSAKRRTHYKISLARPVKDKDGTYLTLTFTALIFGFLLF